MPLSSLPFAPLRARFDGVKLRSADLFLCLSLHIHDVNRRRDRSYMESFFYGQLSGAVEPVAGLLGAYSVQV